MMSTTGRIPVIAAPRPMPVKPGSEIGVSITRSGPNSWTRPLRTLNGVPASATSSPITKTRGSRRISWASASRTASAMLSRRSAIACSRIDVHLPLFGPGIWRVQGELHAFRDLGSDLFLQTVEGDRVGDALRLHRLGQELDGVAVRGPARLLFLGAVVGAIDVADVVPVLAVCAVQQERRSLAGPRPVDRSVCGLVHAAHVLTVRLPERDAERRRAQRDVARCRLEVVR